LLSDTTEFQENFPELKGKKFQVETLKTDSHIHMTVKFQLLGTGTYRIGTQKSTGFQTTRSPWQWSNAFNILKGSHECLTKKSVVSLTVMTEGRTKT
jgi:hypothetical protein